MRTDVRLPLCTKDFFHPLTVVFLLLSRVRSVASSRCVVCSDCTADDAADSTTRDLAHACTTCVKVTIIYHNTGTAVISLVRRGCLLEKFHGCHQEEMVVMSHNESLLVHRETCFCSTDLCNHGASSLRRAGMTSSLLSATLFIVLAQRYLT